MNQTSLLTIGKKLGGSDLYLVSVFDVEPSGVIVQAYNQVDSREYTLPISEVDFAAAGLTRNTNSLTSLLDSIELIPQGDNFVLYSSLDNVNNIKAKIKASNLTSMLGEPLVGSGSPSLNEVLVQGLVELCKTKPVGLDAVTWLGEWLISHNPVKPRVDLDE